MTTITVPKRPLVEESPYKDWPDHTQLPDKDGTMTNFQEHSQSVLLTSSILPVLERRHPDGRFAIGQNAGIYWRRTEAPLEGCMAPDWCYIPDVPPMLNGQVRRSYVQWDEPTPPLLLIEFASGDGSEERDRTPLTGKFWVYEHVIRPPFYAIYEVNPGRAEVYYLALGRLEPLPANERGRFPIVPLGIELGIWRGQYLHNDLPWLRFWDAEGRLLPTADERAVQAEAALRKERERAERLAERLRALGVDPNAP
jgi:Uma2 family endonuclease